LLLFIPFNSIFVAEISGITALKVTGLITPGEARDMSELQNTIPWHRETYDFNVYANSAFRYLPHTHYCVR
jgi:hypothetical protein